MPTGERAGSPLQCAGGGALRALRFSPDGHLLCTAGDDEAVSVWNLHSGELVLSAEGHTDAVSALAVSPDSQLLASCSADESVRLWGLAPACPKCLLLVEAAHDLGAAALDFSPAEGIPGKGGRGRSRGVAHGGSHAPSAPPAEEDDEDDGCHRYLLASGGNDCLVRLWRVPCRYDGDPPQIQVVGARAWRVLAGHAGSVACVRFSPAAGDLLASAAIDRAARLWNVYSGECLHVLEGHDSLLTSVAFSPDCAMLATGSLDKTIQLWELPAHLVFQSSASETFRPLNKRVVEWEPSDVERWLSEWGLARAGARAKMKGLRGHTLLSRPIPELLDILDLDGCEDPVEDEQPLVKIDDGDGSEDGEGEDMRGRVAQLVRWLRRVEQAGGHGGRATEEEPPHEFLCPITHELMRDPVLCSDGFSYERAALTEWLLGGRFTSPMTNAPLSSSRLRPDTRLRARILAWMFGSEGENGEEEDDDVPLIS